MVPGARPGRQNGTGSADGTVNLMGTSSSSARGVGGPRAFRMDRTPAASGGGRLGIVRAEVGGMGGGTILMGLPPGGCGGVEAARVGAWVRARSGRYYVFLSRQEGIRSIKPARAIY